MALRVTFITDEYDERIDDIYDAVMRIGGYDVEIEGVEPEPPPPRTKRSKKA